MNHDWPYNLALEIAGSPEVADRMSFGGIKNAVNRLDSVNKRLIYYRYKDKLTYWTISLTMKMSIRDVQDSIIDAICILRKNHNMDRMLSISMEKHNDIVNSLKEEKKPSSDIPLENINLNNYTKNALKRANITTVGQLIALTENELLDISGIGERTVLHIINNLDAYNLSLKDYESRE